MPFAIVFFGDQVKFSQLYLLAFFLGFSVMVMRRQRFAVYACIIEQCREPDKAISLMAHCGVSGRRLYGYLDVLVRNGLLQRLDGIWISTPKGLEFLEKWKAISLLFEE